MDPHSMRVLTYGVSASVLGCALGIISGFVYTPLSEWWLGESTWIISLALSIIISILVLFGVGDEDLGPASAIATVLTIPVGVVIATTGILLVTNIIFSVVFSIIGLRAFAWGISGLTPTESERLAGSIFSNGLAIGGVILSIGAALIIGGLVTIMCGLIIHFFIREKTSEQSHPKDAR